MSTIDRVGLGLGAGLLLTLALAAHVITSYGDNIRVSKTNSACGYNKDACYAAEARYNTEYLCNDKGNCWTEVK